MSFCRRHTLVTGESTVAGNGPRWRELGAGRRVTPLGMPRAFGEGMKIFWNQPGRRMHSLVSGLRAAELTASVGPSGPGRSAERGRNPPSASAPGTSRRRGARGQHRPQGSGGELVRHCGPWTGSVGFSISFFLRPTGPEHVRHRGRRGSCAVRLG